MRRLEEFHNHSYPVNNVYRGSCKYIVDGDTFDFLVDLGFYTYSYVAVRLLGLDTPELNTDAGKAAKARAYELILNKPVRLITYKDAQTFGRFVADVFFHLDGVEVRLADILRAEGFIK